MGRRSVTENEKTPTYPRTVKDLDENNIDKSTKNKMTKSTKRSKCSLVLNVDMGTESIDEYVKPIHQDDDIVLDVECGPNKAMLYLSKLCTGSKGPCVSFQSSWLTPNEFQYVSGRETAKDWKRSIRHQGKSIKLLLSKGILEFKSLDGANESSNVGQKADKKRRKGGKRQTKKESDTSAPDTALATTVDSHETESQSSSSTIENSYVVDDQCDTISESDKQTDDSPIAESETNVYAEIPSPKTQLIHINALEDNKNKNSENKSETGDSKPSLEIKGIESVSEKCGESSVSEKCGESSVSEKCGESSKDDNLFTILSSNEICGSVTDGFKDSEQPNKIDPLQKLSEETTDDETEPKQDMTVSSHQMDEANDENLVSNSPPTTQEDEAIWPQKVDKANDESLVSNSPPTIPLFHDTSTESLTSVSEEHTPKTCSLHVSHLETKSETSISMDDTNNNIPGGEMIDLFVCKDGDKDNKDTDIISQDTLSPQERTASPPRESRLQSIIEQLRVNKQKGIQKYSSISDSQQVIKTPSDGTSDDFKEGKYQEQCTENIQRFWNSNERSENETAEMFLQEVSSCSRTEGRCSVKDKGQIKQTDRHRQENSHGVDSHKRNHWYLGNQDTKQETTVNNNEFIDRTMKRKQDNAETALISDRTNDQSEFPKRHKGNDLIKLTKPSKSDMIVNGLLDTIYTEKKKEKQTRDGKLDSNPNLESTNQSIDSQNNRLDMFPNNKYTIRNERLGTSNKRPQDFKHTESDLDSVRSRKSETKSPLHIKPSGHSDLDTAFKSTLPRSPKSGSIYPSSFMSLKSKESRCEKLHGQTLPSSGHKNSESPTKTDKSSTSHPDNIYNDYMRLLAATQSNLHLIPYPTVDPYYMMRMSDVPFPSPYVLPHMLQRDVNPSSGDKTDSSSNAVKFFPPPFPPLGMLPPGLPFGFPPVFPDAYKSTTSPSTASICKKSSVSPGTASAKRRPEDDSDALDLSAKRTKLSGFRDDHISHIKTETQSGHYKAQHKISSEKFDWRKMTENVDDIVRNSSTDPMDFRKLHSWIDKSEKNNKSVCKCSAYKLEDIRNWSVERVCRFISKLDGCATYAEIFREHRLDGKRLPLLTTEQLVKSLGMKVGPAITLSEAVTRKVQEQSRNFQPCDYCKRKSNHRISI